MMNGLVGVLSMYANAFAIFFQFLLISIILCSIIAVIIIISKKYAYKKAIEKERIEAEEELRLKNEEFEKINRIKKEAWNSYAERQDIMSSTDNTLSEP